LAAREGSKSARFLPLDEGALSAQKGTSLSPIGTLSDARSFPSNVHRPLVLAEADENNIVQCPAIGLVLSAAAARSTVVNS
jgi:hypothetical protein